MVGIGPFERREISLLAELTVSFSGTIMLHGVPLLSCTAVLLRQFRPDVPDARLMGSGQMRYKLLMCHAR